MSSEEDDVKQQWRKFVLDLMVMSLEAFSQNEELAWSCNFTKLFNDYTFRKSNQANVDEPCLGFDEFLYQKIASPADWHRCNILDHPQRWCLAWKHIAKNFQGNTSFFDALKPLGTKAKSPSYLRDVETVMRWLTSKKEEVGNYENLESNRKIIDEVTRKSGPIQLSRNYHLAPTKTGILADDILCFVSSIPTLFLPLQDCLELFGNSKK